MITRLFYAEMVFASVSMTKIMAQDSAGYMTPSEYVEKGKAHGMIFKLLSDIDGFGSMLWCSPNTMN